MIPVKQDNYNGGITTSASYIDMLVVQCQSRDFPKGQCNTCTIIHILSRGGRTCVHTTLNLSYPNSLGPRVVYKSEKSVSLKLRINLKISLFSTTLIEQSLL